MSEIPEKCIGCKELQAITETKPTTFYDAIERITGKKCSGIGRSGNRMHSTLPPEFVWLDHDKELADRNDVSKAWYEAERSRENIEKRVVDQTKDCPGLLEATAVLEDENTRRVFKICGKTALAGEIVTAD